MKPFHPAQPAPVVPSPTAAAVLSLVALCSVAAPAPAQTTLEPVVVVGSRAPLPLDRVTADVVVIDAARIRASTADSLEDLLRREAGLQLSRNGGPGQSAGLFVRGSASVNTVVLVDGVRVGSATLGFAQFDAFGLSQIERIEVLRGPASSLYGADAVGGVVQIVTRRGDDPRRAGGGSNADGLRLGAHAAAGGYGSGQADVSASGTRGGFDFAASLSRERSDGVTAIRPNDRFGSHNPDADGYARNTAQLRLGFTPAAGHRLGANVIDTRLKSAYDSAVYLPPTFAPDATPDFRSRLHTRTASLDYQGTVNAVWNTTLTLADNRDDSRSEALGVADTTDRFVTRRDQATWQNVLTPSAGQQWVLAVERRRERAQSTSYAGDVKRTNTGLVVGYSGSFGAQAVQADLRRDDNSVYGGVTTGRLGWSVALAPQWRVRALAGSSFRAPSFNDLVFPDYGVITIRPERGRSVEAGVVWQAGASRASATLYRNRVRELIAYQPDTAQCPAGYDFGCASNVARAVLKGVTLDGTQRIGRWQFGGVLDLLSADDADTGRRLARRAPRQLSLQADYAAGSWNSGAALLAVGPRPDGDRVLGGYATLDLKAGWRFLPNWLLEARLLNAADRDVEPVRDYQALGRQAWLGIRYDGSGL